MLGATAAVGLAPLSFGKAGASFAGSSVSPSNTFSTGTVILSDDDNGSALFTTGTAGSGQVAAGRLKPGGSVVNCVRVTHTGTVPVTVRLYASAVSGVNGSGGVGILDKMHVSVEEGTAGAFGCAGFGGATVVWNTTTHPGATSDLLSVFPTTAATGPASPAGTWAAGAARSYRVTLTMDPDTPATAQAATAALQLTWQATSA
ncbi:hypothetical protein [Kineococcus sp. NUM-3379]